MYKKYDQSIVCARCKSTSLSFSAIEMVNGKILNGLVTCKKCRTTYPIINSVICLLLSNDTVYKCSLASQEFHNKQYSIETTMV